MEGRIREIENRKMVEIQGDVWPCEGADDLTAGDTVRVTSVADGVLSVRAERERSK